MDTDQKRNWLYFLKYLIAFPALIAVNLLVRIPFIFFTTALIHYIFGDWHLNFHPSWASLVIIGFRDFTATYFTIYAGDKLLSNKKIGLYFGTGISIFIFIAFLFNYPILISQSTFGEILWEFLLLTAQIVGIYKAVEVFNRENHYFLFRDLPDTNEEKVNTEQVNSPGRTLEFDWNVQDQLKVLPPGAFLDPADRLNSFIKRLDDSIFKSLKIIELEIQNIFEIAKDNIFYEVYISRRWYKNVNLLNIENLVHEYIRKHGDENFQFQMIINCSKKAQNNDIQFWGTVIDIFYWYELELDEETDEQFMIWYLSIEGEDKLLNQPYINEDFLKIKNRVIENLTEEYVTYYGDKW